MLLIDVDCRCPCPDIVVSILFWIGYFNSTLNPVIYVMTNRDFKDAFTDILRKIFCWCCPSSRSSRQPGLMIDRQHLHENRGSYGGGVSRSGHSIPIFFLVCFHLLNSFLKFFQTSVLFEDLISVTGKASKAKKISW